MYGALVLVTLLALLITFSKMKVVEMMAGTPDSRVTFKPVKQRTGSSIMYTGNGFMPEDWYFFHSGVCFHNSEQTKITNIYITEQGKLSDRAEKSLRILDTLRWTGPTLPTTRATTKLK